MVGECSREVELDLKREGGAEDIKGKERGEERRGETEKMTMNWTGLGMVKGRGRGLGTKQAREGGSLEDSKEWRELSEQDRRGDSRK